MHHQDPHNDPDFESSFEIKYLCTAIAESSSPASMYALPRFSLRELLMNLIQYTCDTFELLHHNHLAD